MLISITIARIITSKSPDEITNDPMYQAALFERIKPVASVQVGGSANQGGGAAVVSGEEIYKTACLVCHGSGVAGSPKYGDKAAWKSRIAQGMATLITHAIKGFKGMPPKGGRADLSDDAVKAAVKYMADNSK